MDVEDSGVVGTGSPVPGDHAREKGKKVFAEASGDLSSYFGQQIAFSDLISAGALVKSSNGTYTASSANGYTQGDLHFDPSAAYEFTDLQPGMTAATHRCLFGVHLRFISTLSALLKVYIRSVTIDCGNIR